MLIGLLIIIAILLLLILAAITGTLDALILIVAWLLGITLALAAVGGIGLLIYNYWDDYGFAIVVAGASIFVIWGVFKPDDESVQELGLSEDSSSAEGFRTPYDKADPEWLTRSLKRPSTFLYVIAAGVLIAVAFWYLNIYGSN